MEAAHELLGLAAGVAGPLRRIDQPAAAMLADIVVGLDLIGRGPHDQNRVIEDVISEIIADFGDLLDAAGLLPHFAPQLVTLGADIVLRNIGFHADSERLGKLLGWPGLLPADLDSLAHDAFAPSRKLQSRLYNCATMVFIMDPVQYDVNCLETRRVAGLGSYRENPPGGTMDFDWDADQSAFRATVCAFLAAHLPSDAGSPWHTVLLPDPKAHFPRSSAPSSPRPDCWYRIGRSDGADVTPIPGPRSFWRKRCGRPASRAVANT